MASVTSSKMAKGDTVAKNGATHQKSSPQNSVVGTAVKLDKKTAVLSQVPMAKTSEMKGIYDQIGLQADKFSLYSKLMLTHSCYDLMPSSCKVVVFNTKMKAQKAFEKLADCNGQGALLYDCKTAKYIGMLKEKDFVQTCESWTNHDDWKKSLEDMSIGEWRKKNVTRPFIFVVPDDNLFSAVKVMVDNNFNSIPVIDVESGDILYLMTARMVLKYLLRLVTEWHELSSSSHGPHEHPDECILSALGSFTIDKMWFLLKFDSTSAHLTTSTPTYKALEKIKELNIRALPVSDAKGKVVQLFTINSAILAISKENYHAFEDKVSSLMEDCLQKKAKVVKTTDQVQHVVEIMVEENLIALVVVNEAEEMVGIITPRDILQFLVIAPVEVLQSGEEASEVFNKATYSDS